MTRVHEGEHGRIFYTICNAVERGDGEHLLPRGKGEALDGRNADADARERPRPHDDREKVALRCRHLRAREHPVDLIHEDDGMLGKAVGAEHALRPFPVLCDDGEIFAARIDGKIVQNSISRCVPPRFLMATRFTCSGSSPAMFSLHSTRQMPPRSK